MFPAMRDYVAKNGLMLGFRRFRRVAGDLISYTGCNVISLGTSYLVLSSAFELSSSTRAELKSHASLTGRPLDARERNTKRISSRHPESILSCVLTRYQRNEYNDSNIELFDYIQPLRHWKYPSRSYLLLFRVTIMWITIRSK